MKPSFKMFGLLKTGEHFLFNGKQYIKVSQEQGKGRKPIFKAKPCGIISNDTPLFMLRPINLKPYVEVEVAA